MTSCEGALAVDAARGPVVLDRATALLSELQPFRHSGGERERHQREAMGTERKCGNVSRMWS